MSNGQLTVEVRRARNRREEEACRALVAATYLREYGVVLTERRVDPNGHVERFPDRFAVGMVRGELVACAGLYEGETYVERYGRVTASDIERTLAAAGISSAGRPLVEYTKVVVRKDYGGLGIGRHFIGLTHARDFLVGDHGRVPLVLVCARISVFRLWEAAGIRTRHLAPFPWYRNHERYRSPQDPMESRVVVPELDVDPSLFDHGLPGRFRVEQKGAAHAY